MQVLKKMGQKNKNKASLSYFEILFWETVGEKEQFWIWIISFLRKALEDIRIEIQFMAGNDL